MAQQGNKALGFAGFIVFFIIALSGFEYLETGQLNWYKAPLISARDVLHDLEETPAALPLNIAGEPEFSGRVTSITDGDTLRVINSLGESQIIRLYGIDAPERDQPYGTQATNALRQKLSNSQISIIQQDIDDYGRIVGTIFLNERNINQEMVAQGHAWWYEFFAPENRELEEAQNQAQNSKSGLWKSPNPVDPYEWRRTH